MANAAADARGTSCAGGNANKGLVSSTSSNYPIRSSSSGITSNASTPSNNLDYLTSISRVNAQQGNPSFQDHPLRHHINSHDKSEDHHHHSLLSQQQRCGSLEDCSIPGDRTPPPPPPPANG